MSGAGGLTESSAVRGRGAGRPSFAWVEDDDDERVNDHLGHTPRTPQAGQKVAQEA